MRKLQELANNLAIFQQSIPEDVSFYLFDTKGLIASLPGENIDLKVNIGDTFAGRLAGSVSDQALKEGIIQRQVRGPEAFGVAYIATAVPVFEDGEIVGVFSTAISNHKGDTLHNGAIELSATLEEMSASTEQISQASNDMSKQLQSVSSDSIELSQNIKSITSILSFVQDIASQSHLLGLNAAIEAARAGEHGRGFSVVADEIRKMAEHSKQAVTDIQNQLDTIKLAIVRMDASIQQVASFTQEHSASLEELHATFEQIGKISEEFLNAVINN